MREDEVFEMTWAEILQLISIRDKKTVDAVDIFVSMVHTAVGEYPQGELYDFLAFQTALYAAMVVSGKVLTISDPRQFFRTCGFDSEEIERMIIRFELGVKVDKKLAELEAGKVVE
ncbi:hypothetical protein ES707_20942 [subsurface metagenome]